MQMKFSNMDFNFCLCHNCGGKPEIVFEVVKSYGRIGIRAQCPTCGASTGICWTMGELVNQWNGGRNGCSIRH